MFGVKCLVVSVQCEVFDFVCLVRVLNVECLVLSVWYLVCQCSVSSV